jgi:CheY-like chemotaxis protein
VLEITESAAMTEVAPALENLARLCMNGFSLSIDDYGTGSSNLQQLLRIAFSELKIDQSFVRDFTDNKSLQIVVASSIDMARKLQVKSVAEGVETQQDWDGLNAIGCDTAQGYFIGKPMDIKAFREFAVSFKSRPIPAQPAPNPDVAQKRSALKVLIVEDDDFTRKIIMSVFRDLGFTNLSDVNNASSAVKLLENHVYDLIVTDIKMPGMNGLQFIQMIRAGKTLAKPDTRIVVLTSYSQTAILGSALALDVNGFLVKPVVPTIVEEKLSRALSERLNVHSPVAYESVKTDLDNLTPASKPASAKEMGRRTSDIQVQPAPAAAQAPAENKGNGETSLSLYRLRPGMILREGVYLKDGTLILSSGQTLSELSINRLNDLKTLLSSGNVLVQENLA